MNSSTDSKLVDMSSCSTNMVIMFDRIKIMIVISNV